MAKIKQILKELDNALKENDFTEFLDTIRSDPKCLRIHFEKDSITILHKLCGLDINKIKYDSDDVEEYKIDQNMYLNMLETLIDEFSLDVNVADKHGNTPLHYAVLNGLDNIVDILLDDEDADIEAANHDGLTPLMLAKNLNYKEIEKRLLQRSEFSVLLQDQLIKDHQRTRKHSIIALGAMRPNKPVKPASYEAIESILYFENPELKYKFCGVMETASHNAILSPLIKMMGLSAIRGNLTELRRMTLFKNTADCIQLSKATKEDADFYSSALAKIEKELGKRFKIICVDAPELSSIKVLAPGSRGLYTNKNSVFIATKGLETNEALAYILHESSHFIIKQLYNNLGKPFPPGEHFNPLRDVFVEIVNSLEERLDNLPTESEEDRIASQIIAQVYYGYPKDEWAIELIVRVAQIIALLGEKGIEWLEKNTPELLAFYVNEVNPKIMLYLQEYKATDYLSDIPHEAPEVSQKFTQHT